MSINFKKLSLYKGPEESPGYLLWRVSMQWRTSIENTLKPLNLTHSQFVVLATTSWLTKNNEKVSQVAIGNMAGLDPNTTSQILRNLEKKNLIKRTRAIDERSKSPIVTAIGSQKIAQALPAVEKADEAFFDVLNKQESNGLLKIFLKLIEQK